MAHVWNVINGDIYVSKNGDDVAGDGSMANPYASIEKAYQAYLLDTSKKKIILGTGLYQETVSGWGNINLIGDGNVVFNDEGLSHFNVSYIPAIGDSLIFENINIDYLTTRFLYLSFTTSTDSEVLIYKCRIVGYYPIYANTSPGCRLIFNNTLLNYQYAFANPYGTNSIYLYNNTLIGNFDASLEVIQRINNIFMGCYFSGYATQEFAYYNLFYECTFNRNGVVLTYADMVNSYNYLKGSLSLNPKFNNSEIGDYTLQSDSPCLFAGKNNATIGAFGLGYSFNANSSEFTEEGGAVFSQTTSVNDIIRTSQVINGTAHFLFQLAAGHLTGNIESAWIDLQSIRYLLITRIFANLIYNASGVATSRPDNLEAAGEKAIYYDFELKYCNEESEKDTAAFKNVIWNKAVTIDDSDRGNANPDFVASEAKYISARFIKIKLYMTEA